MQRLAILILLELVFLVGLGCWLGARMHSTKVQIAVINDQIEKLTPTVKEIQNCKSETDKLTPKLELLNQAKERTMRWYNTLDRLTQSLPQSTWLTKLSTKKDASSGALTVSMSGISISQASVGETMLRVQNIPDLENVNLQFTQGSRIGETPAIEFQIDAGMKGTQQVKEVVKNAPNQS